MQSASPSHEVKPPLTCPPKVHDGQKKAVEITVAETLSQRDLESNKEKEKETMPASRKAPWWSRYSGYQKLKGISPNRTRRTVFLVTSAGAVSLVVLLVWLAKTGRLSGFPTKV